MSIPFYWAGNSGVEPGEGHPSSPDILFTGSLNKFFDAEP